LRQNLTFMCPIVPDYIDAEIPTVPLSSQNFSRWSLMRGIILGGADVEG
jgi:hypothetical protein